MKTVIATLGILLFIFFTPKIILFLMNDPGNPWVSYLYTYAFGSAFFVIGIVLIRKFRSCLPGRGHDRFWYIVMWLGLFYFLAIHASWIWLAEHYPYYGGIN